MSSAALPLPGTALAPWGPAPLQPHPGVFDERVFRSLDWLLAEAAARGLRLLLVLTNYWKDYGGMRQYVEWACQRRGEQVRCGVVRCQGSARAGAEGKWGGGCQ